VNFGGFFSLVLSQSLRGKIEIMRMRLTVRIFIVSNLIASAAMIKLQLHNMNLAENDKNL
jgi:hypothetical protein